MPFPRSKSLRYSLIFLAVLVVGVGLLLGGFQIAVRQVPQYRVQLQEWVSEKTGLTIEFSKISARLRRYGPELVFDDAIVRTPDRTRVLATSRRGSVGFDLWTSITQRRLTAGRFTLDSPQIALIRTREGRIRLLGQGLLPDRQKPIAIESLPVGEFRVRDAVVSFRDEITGRGPWSLSGINFTLARQRNSLELTGNASLPRALGESLNFSAHVSGELEQVDSLSSTFSLQGQGLDLAGWADVMPNQWLAPETGRGSIVLSASFTGTRPASVNAEIALSDVSTVAPVWVTPLPVPDPLVPRQADDDDCSGSACKQTAATAEPVEEEILPEPDATPEAPAAALIAFDRVAATFHALRHEDTWEASVTKLDLSRKDVPWRADSIAARWTRTAAGELGVDLSADRVVLQNLWPLLAFLPESDAAAKLRALQATGTIENLSLNLTRPSTQAALQYSLKADVTDAGVRPILRIPGVSGLNAHVEGTDRSGTARLDARDVKFELPRMFRQTLSAQSAQGEIQWQRVPEGWRVGSEDLRVATEDGNAQACISVTIPADKSSPILELDATGDDLNAAATSKYLPVDKLTPKALDWLDHAFIKGRVRGGQVTYRGPMRSFPFRKGEGEFFVKGRLEGGELHYQEGWAPAREFGTRFEFHNEGMKIFGGSAEVGGLRVAGVKGEFPDFKAGNLTLSAHAAGDLGFGLTLLQESPLREALGELFQSLRGQGEMNSDVSLRLPLKHIADRKILVETHLKDATLRSEGVAAPITSLSGTLTVRDTLPESAELEGSWLGGPLEVSIDPLPGKTPAAQMTARGHATAEQLTALAQLPSSVKVTGATNWQLETRFEVANPEMTTARQPRKFTIASDLAGFGIALPYPVGKPEETRRPLKVELEYDGDHELLARTSLDELRSLLRLQDLGDGWHFDRGAIRTDAVAAALPAHPGLRIEGSLDRLVLDDWLALRGDTPSPTRVSDFLKTASLNIGTLQLFGYQFPDIRGMLRADDGLWKVDVAGPSAEGEVVIPEDLTGSQPLTVRLDHLRVSRAGKRDTPDDHRDPRSWPNLRAFVKDFHYEDHPIGAIDLQATRVPQGIQIESLTIVQEAVRAEAQAQWLITPQGEQSSMTANIASTDVAAALRALNYPPAVEAKSAEIAAKLSWPGGFDGDFPARASGTVTLSAQDGQLLSVQPGAGRMLGLFSVGALPRRLALDFSDLTDEGLSFDKIHGDFELREGNAYTSNLLLSGPAAEIGVAGRAGLGARDYDQVAIVTGNLGASLPVAGALAGGPAVGAALLLFSQVFKEPLKGITRGYYRITGSWDNPEVQRVDAAQVKEAPSSAHDGA